MSESKHTPGPWDIDVITDMVAENPEWESATDEQVLADARLIAAAPEMLEALRVFVNYMEHAGDKSIQRTSLAYPLHLAQAAIRKAKGEEEKS